MQVQPTKRASPLPSTGFQTDPLFALQQEILRLQQDVQKLKEETRYLRGCCGVMFDNEFRLAQWVYFAHPNIPHTNGNLFTRLKAYKPYTVSPTYPVHPTWVYGCSS